RALRRARARAAAGTGDDSGWSALRHREHRVLRAARGGSTARGGHARRSVRRGRSARLRAGGAGPPLRRRGQARTARVATRRGGAMRPRGFTSTEILTALIVIAVLAAIAIP